MSTHLIRRKRPRLAAAFVAALIAVPAWAQVPTQDEFQALRFYLQQENDTAVRAEVERLQRQFPGWTPPDDLSELTTTAGPETAEIYRQIEARNFDTARRLIAETADAFPDWSPPQDMRDLLRVSEAQQIFDAAVQAERAETAIGLARNTPELISCERVNNAWNLADMHLLLGETEQAISVFRAVIRTCANVDILTATLEKAEEIFSLDVLAELADSAREQAPEATAQLRQLEDRLRVGRQAPTRWAGNSERKIALDNDVRTIDPTDPPQPRARPTASPTPSPTAAAPTAAPPASGTLAAVRAAANRGAWSECLSLSAGSSNIQIMAQRGWCAFNADRSMDAVDLFRTVAQRSSDVATRRDATYGWLLSLLRLNMTEQAAQVLASSTLTNVQRREVEGQILDQRGVRAYETGDYRRAIGFFEAHERLTGTARRDLDLLRGYALLNIGDHAGARAIFMRLHRQLATPETRRALNAVR